MMNDSAKPSGTSEHSVDSARIAAQSSPPPHLASTARQTSTGRRIVGVLASGLGRRSSSHYSPTGSPNSPSLLAKRQFAFPILAVLAVAALGLWLLFLMNGGLAQAQSYSDIRHAENGDSVLATFTATDPEGARTIVWSVMRADELNTDLSPAAAFSIEGGVLKFKRAPDFEKPISGVDDGSDLLVQNVYKITVQATDGAGMDYGTHAVTVTVTDVEEPGKVTLSTMQPRAGIDITATITEGDDFASPPAIVWTWETSSDKRSWAAATGTVTNATTNATTYTPAQADIDKYLRASVSYADRRASGKSEMAVSEKVLSSHTTTNAKPAFASPTVTITVSEGLAVGANVGAPVTATDTDRDEISYELSDGSTNGDAAFFSIDNMGQLTVKKMLDYEGTNEDHSYEVRVTADDAFTGTPNTATVTINVTNVDEPPGMVSGSDGNIVFMENTEDDDSTDDMDESVHVATLMATDPEGVDIVWSLSGPDRDDFSIEDGMLKFMETPDYEMPTSAITSGKLAARNVYRVTVEASDGTSSPNATLDLQIKVTNGEDEGTVTLSTDQPVIGQELTATFVGDEDGGASTPTWMWHRSDDITGDNPIWTAIDNAIKATYKPVAADLDNHLRATATYSDAYHATDITTTETAMAVSEKKTTAGGNVAPVFPSTMTQRIVLENTEYDAAAMTDDIGSPVAADDGNDDTLTYELSGTDASEFDIDGMGQISVAEGTELNYETKQSYRVMVTATDPSGLDDSINVTIMVIDVDEMPKVTGVDEKEYAENGDSVVTTFAATDPEGARTIVWSVMRADELNTDLSPAAAFSIEGGVLKFKRAPDFEKPISGVDDGSDLLVQNVYKITVQATDGAGMDYGTHAVNVTVTDVEEPGKVTLSTMQPRAGTALTATITDGDDLASAPAIVWTWETSSDKRSWAAATGTVTNATTNATTYTPAQADIDKYLRASVSYADRRASGKSEMAVSEMVLVAHTTANAKPAFASDTFTITVSEGLAVGANVGAPVMATDTDRDEISYELSDGSTNGDAAFFSIDNMGQLTVKKMLDYEGTNEDHSYEVMVTADDAFTGGTLTNNPTTVTINVTNVDEPPGMVSGSDGNIVFMENTEDDDSTDDMDESVHVATLMATDPEGVDIVWSLSGPDRDDFSIEDGMLKFMETPDYEMPTSAITSGKLAARNVYRVTVEASDGTSSPNATLDLQIKVTNGEDEGTVTLSTDQPVIGQELTATFVGDEDGGASTPTWMWHRSDDITGDNPIWTAIDNAIKATYKPVAADLDNHLRATATYSDAYHATDITTTETAMAVSEKKTTAGGNVAPVFPSTMTQRIVLENTEYPAAIGMAVGATDGNTDTLTYELSGTDASEFDIDGMGQISVGYGTKLNYETKQSYSVMVTATDPSGLDDSINVTIMVIDVDEMPGIMVGGLAISGMERVDYAENSRDAVATYTASGPDAASARWSLVGGDDAGQFRIGSSSGELTFVSAPDYENSADADMDNEYMVTVSATDGTNTATLEVTVMVTNVNEAPEFASATTTRSVVESTAAGENIGDPVAAMDADNDTLTYTLGGTDMASFDIDPATGQLMTMAALDFEAKASYTVDVTATDDGGESDTIAVTINVTEVNKAPEFDSAMMTTRSVVENTAAGENIGDPVAAMDANAGDTLTYTLGGTDMASFDINSATGQIMTKAALDFETKTSYTVDVTATDTSGLNATVMVTINVTDEVNEAPEFDSDMTTRSVAENTAAGENIGDPVAAMDANAGDTLTYTLGGTDMASFDINSATGQIMTMAALDFETKATYTVDVTATDDAGESDTIAVTIMVTNMGLDNAYDADDSGMIEKSEVLTAINDYQNEVEGITKAYVITLINMYQGSDGS